MTPNQVMDTLGERGDAGEKAAREEDFRHAAGIFKEVSGGYSDLAVSNPDSRMFLTAMAHLYGAKKFLALYYAGETEKASPIELNRLATEVVQVARKGIAAFRDCGDPNGADLCYGILIDGLLQCVKTRHDPAGVASAENELLDAINEYRAICPAGKGKENLIKLLFVQASIAQTEATRQVLGEFNAQASQAYFKKSRGYLDAVRKLAAGMKDVLAGADENERQGRGMSLFGEGFLAQERGAHAEAMKRFEKAEAELEKLNSPIDLAFARWANAAQHANAAMQSELGGDYESCVREYKVAAKAYAEAAESFPNDNEVFYTNASRMRFYAQASTDRANAALARSKDAKLQVNKGRRSAGLIFFLLWIISGGGAVAASKYLSFTGYESITILLISFIGSMLAAALIKPEVAVQMLGGLGFWRKSKPAAPQKKHA